ncbi:FecR family protein [Chitinophaga qingshengii]|uniref:FecR domain-containing protein n=1 Tax=Chitinophaga qingshengii TaxID=1569794 RepID=A0ABR7TIR1_9BACT|nr:FecR family protein [Chitinophaga qingshengii]MBC9928959.1 FecR domain-containing protein [Chitinophaga qingshengii]
MSNERLVWLFKRHLDKLTTPEEEQELFRLIDLPENEPVIRQVMQEAWNEFSPQHPPFTPAEGDRMLRNITRERRRSGWTNGRIWIAAASVTVLIAVAAIMFHRTQPVTISPITQVAPTVQDVAPGSNKAVLTLADGSTVTLDSTGQQVIRQGGVAIRQQGGRLQYDNAATTGAPAYNVLATPRGGQFRITLPDGTGVWLNAASSLRYPTAFTGTDRTVELDGEAYFEVAADRRLFHVKARGMEVTVFGTRFNIMAYADEQLVKTTLVEGKVKVAGKTTANILEPGQQARLAPGGELSVVPVNTADELAWKNGWFVFQDADIATVMRQLSRWYNVEVSYEGPVSKELFSGKIGRTLTLSQVLQGLAQSNVHSRMEEGKRIIILP